MCIRAIISILTLEVLLSLQNDRIGKLEMSRI